MTEQLELLGDDRTPEERLTGYQRHALEQVRSSPDGMFADELGAAIHERRLAAGRMGHTSASRCPYCDRDGKAMLRVLRTKGLVVRRRKTGRWQALAEQTLPPPAVPYDELPEGF